MEEFYIPKNLDEPARFLFWAVDEASVMLSPLFIGLVSDYPLSGIMVGLVGFFVWRRLKKKQSLIHAAYWYLPTMLFSFKATPASYIRHYIR